MRLQSKNKNIVPLMHLLSWCAVLDRPAQDVTGRDIPEGPFVFSYDGPFPEGLLGSLMSGPGSGPLSETVIR